MPDSFDYKIVITRIPDDGRLSERREIALAKFPPNSLNNLPLDFIQRCVMDPRPEFTGCVVLRYQDGTIPHRIPDVVKAKTYPTYKNMQGKKFSAIGMSPNAFKQGTVVKQSCGNIYCVNQNHLVLPGTVVDVGHRAAQTYKDRREAGYYGENPESNEAE